jgi:hypothetical protein
MRAAAWSVVSSTRSREVLAGHEPGPPIGPPAAIAAEVLQWPARTRAAKQRQRPLGWELRWVDEDVVVHALLLFLLAGLERLDPLG